MPRYRSKWGHELLCSPYTTHFRSCTGPSRLKPELRTWLGCHSKQLAILVLLSTSWPRIQPRVDDIQAAVDRSWRLYRDTDLMGSRNPFFEVLSSGFKPDLAEQAKG